MKYRIGEIQKALSPNPFGLLTTLRPDGKTNIMAISWWTFVSNNPPSIAVCLSNRGFSGELIKNTSEFALNIVGEPLKESAFRCGTCSGRTIDKAEEFYIPLTDADIIGAKLVKDSKVSLECKFTGSYTVSDHTIYVGEIIETHYDSEQKQLFAYNGYGRLDTI